MKTLKNSFNVNGYIVTPGHTLTLNGVSVQMFEVREVVGKSLIYTCRVAVNNPTRKKVISKILE